MRSAAERRGGAAKRREAPPQAAERKAPRKDHFCALHFPPIIDFRASSSDKPTSEGHLWCLYNVLTTYSLAAAKYFSISYEGSEASIAKCVIFAASYQPRATFDLHEPSSVLGLIS